jgi:hypothetical protein
MNNPTAAAENTEAYVAGVSAASVASVVESILGFVALEDLTPVDVVAVAMSLLVFVRDGSDYPRDELVSDVALAVFEARTFPGLEG